MWFGPLSRQPSHLFHAGAGLGEPCLTRPSSHFHKVASSRFKRLPYTPLRDFDMVTQQKNAVSSIHVE